MALIPGVSDCAAVTDANLAAITGTLDLSGQNITALAAGDFAGLTALIELYLNNNKLTTLRGDVFAGLTALTQLQLNNNELETLPKDVFTKLPLLKLLTLYDNDLDTLPDGVFEPLTALAYLGLYGNPGAPFAPTAVALPDAGTVPVAGGTVTLDGSGSGGPWGTNVTYAWALTTPASGVRVTFDDSTSATPEATIPNLAAGTELAFTLTVTGPGGTQGIAPSTDTAKVTATEPMARAARSNSAATGAPTISGRAQVGETLTADTSGIADDDGLTKVTYSYQWIRNDGTSDTDITGAADFTYTLAADDEGKTIKARVSFTDDAGNRETLTSTETVAATAAERAEEPAPAQESEEDTEASQSTGAGRKHLQDEVSRSKRIG